MLFRRGSCLFNELLNPCSVVVYGTTKKAKDQTSFSHDISLWDISSVIDMSDMLQDSKFFTSDITNWNVSKVKNMGSCLETMQLLIKILAHRM